MLTLSTGLAAQDADPLVGIWEAKRIFGPTISGSLDITRSKKGWRARIAQFEVPVAFENNHLSFELPEGQGRFNGRLDSGRSIIRGHWIQPPTINKGRGFASPAILTPYGNDRWTGEIVPLNDEWTVYLVVSRKPDGSLAAFLRNPDRNIGVVSYVERLELDGNRIRLIGRPRPRVDNYLGPAINTSTLPLTKERVFVEGTYYPADKRVSIYFPNRGGTYDFVRVRDNAGPGFYARGKTPEAYTYQEPKKYDDGWKVGSLNEARINVEPIAELVQAITAPTTSVHDPYIHAFLVARHGKLVLEEYFHGFHRMKPHDTRSATKSVAAILVGSVMEHTSDLKLSTPVYDLLYHGQLPENLDPRKKQMTVEHLLTMSSGYDCDDAAFPPRPGGEDILHDQKPDADYYRYTLELPMELKPGQEAIYCSINPNLIGAVLSEATKKPVLDLFQDLVAEPLQLRQYHLFLQPTGEPYLGGSSSFLPRDFLKFGQLMLNGGVWNGKRILSQEFVLRASSPRVSIRYATERLKWKYGYLWWTIDFPYKNRTVSAYFSSGNGGQTVVVIPELDVVIAVFAGNYGDSVATKIQSELIPKFVLPALN